jgi:hypothetical protein
LGYNSIYNYLSIGERDINDIINSVLHDVYIITTPFSKIKKGDIGVEIHNGVWCCPAKYSMEHSASTITFPELFQCRTADEIITNTTGAREYGKMTIEQLTYHILHYTTHKERLLVDYISMHKRELLPLFGFNFSEIHNKYWEGIL